MNTVFNHSAREYDDWFVRNEPAYRSELAAVKAFLPLSGRGLEIGVGTGRFAGPLGIEVGVEPARAMAAIARQRGIQVLAASRPDRRPGLEGQTARKMVTCRRGGPENLSFGAPAPATPGAGR